ncbi:MAG: sigma-70 family RNA polymerase sigma factor [Sphaerochaetaceae bacterium]|nr:sigma-70 family RNA polymerase sigma factor [Sphaerochaetaceae bacterium]
MDYYCFADELPHDYRLVLDSFINLTPEEELSLSVKASEGDLEARNSLVLSFQRFLLKMASSYMGKAPSLELMDLIQSGNTGLIRASEMFDSSKGVRFTTYAAYWIRQAMISAVHEGRMIWLPDEKRAAMAEICRFLRDHKGASAEEISSETGLTLKTVLSLLPHTGDIVSASSEDEEDSYIFPQVEDNCLQNIILKEQLSLLRRAVEHLPSRQKAILKSHYGVFGEEQKSLSLIASSLGLSKERVRQIECQALEGCRAYMRRSA